MTQFNTSTPFPSLLADDLDQASGLFRVLDEQGVPITSSLVDGDTGVSDEAALRIWKTMVRVRTVDERMLALQRQGRIGFYGAATGQEAGVVGAAEALEFEDWIHPALREGGMALHRGFSLRTWLAHCFGNEEDTCTKGRQMPCHYGSRAHNYVTLSSVMTTQFPQAVGTAYAMALRHPKQADRPVCFAAIGDGATSEGDFHVAMNFAGVMKPGGIGLPLVLFCQNNQWAISTPFDKQCAAPSLALKAIGYGLAGVRVDGNDALAVTRVVKAAAAQARAGGVPVFIEALTYRVGAHTTSDDPSRYRDESITDRWRELDPIVRLERYLARQGVLAEDQVNSWRDDCDREVRGLLEDVESLPAPQLLSLFEDVYAEVPPHLQRQFDDASALGQ
ncbi:MAG TPA: 3-methyl-2-oxobutanoate dehydrogenase [Myxococcales bacterium]|nr:3-methyl-2-oxobutanoate dehydrogenase [Myxococcales bacterium]